MNRNAYSAECLSGMCPACEYEDCACECHFDGYAQCGDEREAGEEA